MFSLAQATKPSRTSLLRYNVSTAYAQSIKLQSCPFEVVIEKINSFPLGFDTFTRY